jgi:SAM-dependent methyltransferase
VLNDIMPWGLEGVELGGNVLEIGPGPGTTTDYLRGRVERLTSLEIDRGLAASLRERTRGGNVEVVDGDATEMPFEDGRFSGAVSFTMLHHVPRVELQDRLLRETYRVLRPGAVFAGVDSRDGWIMKVIHIGDVMNLVDPETFGERLERAGFRDVSVEANERRFRFRGIRPRRTE